MIEEEAAEGVVGTWGEDEEDPTLVEVAVDSVTATLAAEAAVDSTTITLVVEEAEVALSTTTTLVEAAGEVSWTETVRNSHLVTALICIHRSTRAKTKVGSEEAVLTISMSCHRQCLAHLKRPACHHISISRWNHRRRGRLTKRSYQRKSRA
jgi:hypothetical protein